MIPSHPYTEILSLETWQEIAARHLEEARTFTANSRKRRDRGEAHPVEDFLFDYYPYPLALIELWHPGIGTAIASEDAENLPRTISREAIQARC